MAVFFVTRSRITVEPLHRLSRNPVVLLFGAVFLASFLVLTLSTGLSGMGETFNSRYITPLLLMLIILALALVRELWLIGLVAPRLIAAAFLVSMGGLFAFRSVSTVKYLSSEGLGYSSRRWHISETISYIQDRPENSLISTAPVGIYFWTGNLPAGIPRNGDYVLMRSEMCENSTLLVIIDSLPPEFYGVETEDLTSGLTQLQKFSEGSIYACPDDP